MPMQPSISPTMPPQMQAQAGANPAAQAPMSKDTPVQGAPQTSKEMQSPIIKGLEQHLNTIPDDQKKFLADAMQHAPQVIIPVLGIVNGPEVYDYFTMLYNQYFKQDSAQAPQGGQPQAAPPSGQPAPSAGAMAPMSSPAAPPQGMMNPQAKATPSPMMGG